MCIMPYFHAVATASIMLVFTVFVSGSTFNAYANQEYHNVSDLVFLGAVAGKSCFYELANRTWPEGKAFCNEAGMHLATITSASQTAFLWDSYIGGKFDNNEILSFWTDARNEQTLAKFVWNHNGEQPPESVVRLGIPTHTCLVYHVNPKGASYHSYPCFYSRYTLCEFMHSKLE